MGRYRRAPGAARFFFRATSAAPAARPQRMEQMALPGGEAVMRSGAFLTLPEAGQASLCLSPPLSPAASPSLVSLVKSGHAASQDAL